jgi:hypothetical protein
MVSRSKGVVDTHRSLQSTHEILGADFEYTRSQYQEASTRASELGRENIELQRYTESARSAARYGVQQAQILFSAAEKANVINLQEARVRISMLEAQVNRLNGQWVDYRLWKSEILRLGALGIDAEREIDIVVANVLGAFEDVSFRWQEDLHGFAEVGIDPEDFVDLPSFAKTVLAFIGELQEKVSAAEAEVVAAHQQFVVPDTSLRDLAIQEAADKEESSPTPPPRFKESATLLTSYRSSPIVRPRHPSEDDSGLSGTSPLEADMDLDEARQEVARSSKNERGTLRPPLRGLLGGLADHIALTGANLEVAQNYDNFDEDPMEYPCICGNPDGGPCLLGFTSINVRLNTLPMYRCS